jgi:hypothetical protein
MALGKIVVSKTSWAVSDFAFFSARLVFKGLFLEIATSGVTG